MQSKIPFFKIIDILYFLIYSVFAQIWDDAKRTEHFQNYSAIKLYMNM